MCRGFKSYHRITTVEMLFLTKLDLVFELFPKVCVFVFHVWVKGLRTHGARSTRQTTPLPCTRAHVTFNHCCRGLQIVAEMAKFCQLITMVIIRAIFFPSAPLPFSGFWQTRFRWRCFSRRSSTTSSTSDQKSDADKRRHEKHPNEKIANPKSWLELTHFCLFEALWQGYCEALKLRPLKGSLA